MEKGCAKYSLISSNRLCFLAVVMCFRDGCTAAWEISSRLRFIMLSLRDGMRDLYRSTGELGAFEAPARIVGH